LESFIKISKVNEENYESSQYLIHTVVDSLYSSLLETMKKLADIFFEEIINSSRISSTIDILTFTFMLTDLIICLGADIIFIYYISRYQSVIMTIFLEIPRKYVIFLNAQCESYTAEFRVLI